MLVTNFEIIEVRLTKLDAKSQIASLKVLCSDEEKPIYIDLDLKPGLEHCAQELVKKVKRERKKEDTDTQGPLGGLSIVNVLNNEEVVAQVFKGLIRVDQKIANLKRVRVASEYMKVFDQINTLQETLYKKRSEIKI